MEANNNQFPSILTLEENYQLMEYTKYWFELGGGSTTTYAYN